MECKVNSGNMKEAIFFLKRKNIFYGNASTSFTFLSLGSMSDAIFVALSSTKISPAKFYCYSLQKESLDMFSEKRCS